VEDLTALVPLGWNARLAEAAAAARAEHPDATPGRVARVDKRMVNVLTADGKVRAATGAESLATGDWVLLAAGEKWPDVVALLPRHSAFVRGDPMDGTARNAQVVAANIDTVFVTQSLENGPNLRRLERELVLSFESGAEPVIVLTKSDLADADSERDLAADVAAVERTAVGCARDRDELRHAGRRRRPASARRTRVHRSP
jgi:ribosome biogenesis GTPase